MLTVICLLVIIFMAGTGQFMQGVLTDGSRPTYINTFEKHWLPNRLGLTEGIHQHQTIVVYTCNPDGKV